MRKTLTLLSVFVLAILNVQAQDCNCVASTTDLTVTTGQTVVVNAYYPGSADAVAGSTSITIGAKRTIPGAFTDLGGTISAGDLLMVIQMQGAEIDPTISDITVTFAPGADVYTTSDYGDGPGGLDHEGFLNNGNYIAGQYEFVMATNAIGAGGGTLTIEDPLTNSYINNTTPTATIGRRTFQVIKVGNYNDLTIDAGGEITTVPWNGATGGIISIDALGTMNVNGTIDANFAGFRGGHLDLSGGDNSDPDNGVRGEGIAGTPQQVFGYNDDLTTISGTTGLAQGYPGGTETILCDITFTGTTFNDIAIVWTADRGNGAPGNAGGGGLLNNGGGGGSNGSGGGNGANEGTISSGGGAAIDLENGSRLILGGGGGSGGQTDVLNDGFPEDVNSGRPGGGSILIRAGVLQSTGTTGVINANGDDGNTFAATDAADPDDDGSGGGGGAGGTVIVITSSEDLSDLTINSTGGDGAGLTGVQVFLSPDGGGGGGSGGNVMLVRRGGEFTATPTIDVTGGALGATQGTPDNTSTGGDGAVTLLTTPPVASLDCPLIATAPASPGGVDDAIIWFNPEQNVTFNGTNQVSAWNDFSASNFTATTTAVSGLTGTNPDYIAGSFTDAEASSNPNFNFNSSISFNEGADNGDYLGFTAFNNLSTGAVTSFAVVNFPTVSPNDQTIYSYLPNDSQNDELDLGITDDGGSDGIRKRVLDNSVDRAGDVRDDITRIIATDYDNVDVNIYLNNGAATNAALVAGTFDAAGTFVLGQDIDDFGTPAFDNTRELQGQLGEVIYFSRIITDTERQKVSSYLGIKYGITIDQTTDQDYLNSVADPIYPVVTESASYAAYDNDIAGIGRDDASRLTQLRSKSINADAIVTGSRTAGFSIDRQFVVWGNNNGGTTFNTTEISTGITNRIQREWRVATTNSPDEVNLTFDLSGTTSTPAVSDNVALVIDDDGDFSNGFLRSVSANSWDGATATFENVQLNDDEVLTIATVPATPGGAAGLTLWLKADAGTTGTTTVTAWDDQSGNANNTTAVGNGPELQTNALNSNPVLDFDDTNTEYLRGAAGGFNTPSYYVVFQPDDQITNATTQQVLVGFDTPSATNNFGALSLGSATGAFFGETITHIVGGTGTRYRSGASGLTLTAGVPLIVGIRDDVATPTTSDIFLTGTDSDDLIDGAIITETDENFDVGRYNTGNGFGNTNYFDGKIAEILSYSNRVSDTEHQQIQSYLAIKYGITLDGDEADYIASDGDFIYETVIVPANYNNDIAGIGRDDISELDQRSSLSVNTDAIVTMALTDNGGTFASPNAFTANLSFIAWGNDNDDDGTIEDVTSEVPANVVTRLDREWRVQEKGVVGNVTLEIDISGVTANGGGDFTGRTAESFLLMIDDGGDFSNGISRSIPATSFNAGTEVITFVVDFIDGDIFSVATSLVTPTPGGVSTNIVTWLRGDEGTSTTTDNTTLTTWTDQSSASNSATSDGNPPLFKDNATDNINGNPVVDFDGTDDRLALTLSSLIGSNYALFGAGRRQNANANQYIVGFGDASGTGTNEILQLGYSDNTTATLSQQANDLDATVAAFNSPQIDPFLIYGEFFGTGHGVQENRNSVLTTNSNANTDALSGTNTGFIGFSSGSQFFEGEIGEIVGYSSALTADEETRVYSYLAVKYGITMNGGNYEYTSAVGTVFFPGNSDTDFASHRTDVAGIGRDDNSDFEQLSSGSVNSTAVLSVTKSAAFDGSDQYIMWAHNGTVVASATATDFPSGTEGRLDRVWRVKLTNSPSGTIDMTFDLTGVSVDQASDLRLVIDSDGDFSDATVLSPSVSQNGNNYTFTGVNVSSFTDKDFFTIASIDDAASPLPLDFLSFSVTEQNGNALLNWTTTNEVNVARFEIERSANGTDFEVIGLLKANNVSDAINSYDFNDSSPLQEVNYYRIKQVDFDGAFEYTRIEFVLIQGAGWKVNVYPNPTTHSLNVITSLPTSGRLKIVDLSGRVIMDYPTADDRSNSLDVSNLPSGIYQLEFNSVLGVQRVRFVKD